jgi:ABC-2 type transport system permease protein
MRGFWTEFKHTMRRLRGQIIGWGIGLALYGLIMGAMFDTVQTIEGLEEMIASYPRELMAFFGDLIDMSTPAGYFGTYYSSYMPVIVGIFAVAAAAGLLAGDEERGTLDLTLSYPIGRTALFWGRWLGFVVATALIMLIGYAGWAITLPMTSMEATAVGLLQAHLPILALLWLFGGLALLLSMLLPSARTASMTAGGLLVANFLLVGLANLNDQLQPIMDLTPFAFFQGGEAINELNWGWIIGLTAAAFALAAAAWLLFRRRDIRVGGERGWSWRPRPSAADH